MTKMEYVSLLSEKTELERMLAQIPEADIIDRMSLQSRLDNVNDELVRSPAPKKEPATVKITFNGKPVVGGYGIFADFGTKAIARYSDAIATFAASRETVLSVRGPIPHREVSRLLVTNIAVGSFGFILEENGAVEQMEVDNTAVSYALEQTNRLLEASVSGSDDELAEIASDTDPRALKVVKDFIQILSESEAICTISTEKKLFRFADSGQVKKSLARLSDENLHEEEIILDGEIMGVLPSKRTLEFCISHDEMSVFVKISANIVNPKLLNNFLDSKVQLKVIATTVGNGQPKYVLIENPVLIHHAN